MGLSVSDISGIPLVEVIGALRKDLVEAQANSDPEHPLIVQDVEVEFQVVVTKTGELDVNGKAEFNLSVLDWFKLGEANAELNLKGKLEKMTTQKVKLKLSAATLDNETKQYRKMRVASESSVR